MSFEVLHFFTFTQIKCKRCKGEGRNQSFFMNHMKSILNIQVSCFANYDTPGNPKAVNLLSWLKSEKYRNQVERIRSIVDKTERDSIKATLPAITPSGLFTYRSVKHLVKHSTFIQFDIDEKGNESVGNFRELKSQISRIKNVAYCGLSVSGTGFWGLIPIAYPDKHDQHLKAIQQSFTGFGIAIDPAPKSVASLRGYSYDPGAYFNHNASVFEKLYTAPTQSYKRASATGFTNAQKVYETAGKLISGAQEGQKWLQLSKASYLLGGYAAAGLIDSVEALAFLKSMIEQRRDVRSMELAFKTIEKSFVEGRKAPISE